MPQVWNDFDAFVLNTLPSTKITISAETCQENTASTQHPGTQTPMSQPHPTKHHPPNADPNLTTQKIAHKTLRLRSEIILHTSTSQVSTRFLASSHESDTSCFHPKPSPKVFAQCGQISDDATTTDDDTEHAKRTQVQPPGPSMDGNPSLCIREKTLAQLYITYI